MRAWACLAVLAYAGCGAASDGAALVHGALFSGRAPWQTSLEFTGAATVHGAPPFRVVVTRPGERGTGRQGLPAGLTVEMRVTRMPRSGQALAVGEGDEGPQASVTFIPEGPSSPTEIKDGADLRYSDGGFVVKATSGRLEVDLDGTAPGDGVRGSFELVFRTGEHVSGTFAAALAD